MKTETKVTHTLDRWWKEVNQPSVADFHRLKNDATELLEELRAMKFVIEKGCPLHHLPLTNGWSHICNGKTKKCCLSLTERDALSRADKAIAKAERKS